jgi:hypothetical protein
MQLLIKYDTFSEPVTKFYVAEICLAIATVPSNSSLCIPNASNIKVQPVLLQARSSSSSS